MAFAFEAFAARLRAALAKKGYKKQAEVAELLGVSRGYLSELLKGKKLPSDIVLSLIESKMGIRAEWLREGKPPMFFLGQAPAVEPEEVIEGVDTLGKRLRYFREHEVGETREEFVVGLGITPRLLEKYESDKTVPDAQFFTKLNAKHHGLINLDWLLTGRGGIYIKGVQSEKKVSREGEQVYMDNVLEKMHRQLDKIYKERDFLKLAAIQSLLNLAEPREEDSDEEAKQ
jgi:transcriptional regulator with XRE-family HTH domain